MGHQRGTLAFTDETGRTIVIDPHVHRTVEQVREAIGGLTISEWALLGALCEMVDEAAPYNFSKKEGS